ncbi:MAG TPA: PAS domain-containing protein [Phycisphaerae bacterium]|nr:PAS domain-containing protein [Phycisphaerae bacterium]
MSSKVSAEQCVREASDSLSEVLREVMAHTSTAMAVIDGGTLCFRWCNAAYQRELEEPYRSRGVEGAAYRAVFGQGWNGGLEEHLLTVVRERRGRVLPEFEVGGGSRTAAYWRVEMAPLGGADVLLQAHDVTEMVQARRKAQARAEALKASNERWELALRGTQDGIWDWDIVNDQVYWSPRAKEMIGYGEHEIDTREAVRELMHPDDREAAWTSVVAQLQGEGNHLEVEYRLRHKGGGYRWVLARGLILREAAGKAVRVVGSHTDVTERREMEDELRSDEGRLQVALEAAKLALWAVDFATGAVTESDAMVKLFGLPPGTRHVHAGEWAQYLEPADLQRLQEAYFAAIGGSGDFMAETRLRGADGVTRWVSGRGRVIRAPGGEPVRMVGVCSDITAQKRAQEELESAKDAAEAANLAKDRFLAVLSHELRTPLTPVVITLAALENDGTLPEGARQDVAMIRRNIDLETQLIDDLLDVTRIANGKLRLSPRAVKVHELLEHVCTICGAEARAKGVELLCELEAGADLVDADPGRLEQVFWNLLKNAIKFTPAGGKVEMLTRMEEEAGGAWLRVSVADTGVGIVPEVKERIFNAFEQGEQTVTRTFGGLGLGLAISKAIVELHGGKIGVESEGKGKGAMFFVLLPMKGEARGSGAAASGAGDGRGGAREGKALRILLVDDHADTLRVTERLLGRLGMQVSKAATMREAVAAAEAAAFDLLISDIGLPDGSGLELLGRVRRVQPGLPAIALSGFGMDADVERSAAAGFRSHLTKPVEPEELERAIREAVAGETQSAKGKTQNR